MKKIRTLVVLAVLAFSYSISFAFATVWGNDESQEQLKETEQVFMDLSTARFKIAKDTGIDVMARIDVTSTGDTIPDQQTLTEYCSMRGLPQRSSILLMQSFKPKLTYVAANEWEENNVWRYFTQEDIEEIELYFGDFDQSIADRATNAYAVVCDKIYRSGELEITPEIQELLTVYDEITKVGKNEYYIMAGIIAITAVVLFLVSRNKKKENIEHK